MEPVQPGFALAAIDSLIIIFYMAGSLALGTYFSRYVKTGGDLFTAGRSLPFWAIGMSIVVSDIGAIDFIAVAGATYQDGLAPANFDWIGSMPAMVFAAFFFIPYYWRSGVYTIPEFLGRRYNVAVQLIHGSIWGIVFLIGLSVMLWETADKFLYGVLGWPIWPSIILIAVIAGIYTFSGGLTAVVMTDVVQLVIMFVGGFALLAIALWHVDGIGGLVEGLASDPATANHLNILLDNNTTTGFPWSGIVFGLGIVLSIHYMAGNQGVVQRTLGARTEWDAKGGMLFGGFLKCFIPLLVAVPGLCAVLIFKDHPLPDPEGAVPELIKVLLPPGLRGLMFAALFAALMSSIDSSLNSASTIWTTDLYGRLIQMARGKEISQRHALMVGRGFTLFFIALAAALSETLGNNDGLYKFLQTILSMFAGPVLAILILGILWRRANQWGGLAGLVLGVCCTTILHNTADLFAGGDPFLYVSWWSFIFSLGVVIVVSLATPADPEEKTRGLVWGQLLEDGKIQRVLGERVSS